jgi:hypothetical protein
MERALAITVIFELVKRHRTPFQGNCFRLARDQERAIGHSLAAPPPNPDSGRTVKLIGMNAFAGDKFHVEGQISSFVNAN